MTDAANQRVESPAGNRIRRHCTAIRRADFSLPMKCLLRDGLVDPTTRVFDFGCGHGQDVHLLNARGVSSAGWDPVFRPNAPFIKADVVNLGYVINVIEDPDERAETIRRAWSLCDKVLTVSAQIEVRGRGTSSVPFGDGIVTRLRTFQKYFTQDELRDYVEAQLGTAAVAAAPGVFYVFRDESLRESFMAARYRRRFAAPRKTLSEQHFEEHRQILELLMEAVTSLGRLPESDEFADIASITAKFGSVKRAFALIRRVTGEEEWAANRQQKTEDLLVYLALARFRRRPPISKLPVGLQRDIRAFFGTYKKACDLGDSLLFRAGDASAIDEECRQSKIGKLLPNALYVHHTAAEFLAPILRVYEGCARMYVGEVPDTTLIKLHRFSGKVSYLAYPDFDDVPHPSLVRGVKVALRSREVFCYDYAESDNPPVLHRKEAFLHPDHKLHRKFAKLTEQEERHHLLDESATIGTREGWDRRLNERGFQLRGHRLVRKSSDSGVDGHKRMN